MAINEIEEFISYRLDKSEEVYSAAILLYDAGQWNSKFSECVVRTGEMSADEYRVYSKLLNWRTKGDYSDMFDFTKEDVDDVMQPARQFIDKVKTLL